MSIKYPSIIFENQPRSGARSTLVKTSSREVGGEVILPPMQCTPTLIRRYFNHPEPDEIIPLRYLTYSKNDGRRIRIGVENANNDLWYTGEQLDMFTAGSGLGQAFFTMSNIINLEMLGSVYNGDVDLSDNIIAGVAVDGSCQLSDTVSSLIGNDLTLPSYDTNSDGVLTQFKDYTVLNLTSVVPEQNILTFYPSTDTLTENDAYYTMFGNEAPESLTIKSCAYVPWGDNYETFPSEPVISCVGATDYLEVAVNMYDFTRRINVNGEIFNSDEDLILAGQTFQLQDGAELVISSGGWNDWTTLIFKIQGGAGEMRYRIAILRASSNINESTITDIVNTEEDYNPTTTLHVDNSLTACLTSKRTGGVVGISCLGATSYAVFRTIEYKSGQPNVIHDSVQYNVKIDGFDYGTHDFAVTQTVLFGDYEFNILFESYGQIIVEITTQTMDPVRVNLTTVVDNPNNNIWGVDVGSNPTTLHDPITRDVVFCLYNPMGV